jgi:ribonuclease R
MARNRKKPTLHGRRARSSGALSSSPRYDRNQMNPTRPSRLPSREEVLDYLASSPMPLARRDLTRAFRVPPNQRAAFKTLIAEIERSGLMARDQKRGRGTTATLPEIGMIEIVDVDFDGEMVARPVGWRGTGEAPRITVVPETRTPALGRGERAVARFAPRDEGGYEARIIRAIEGTPDRIVGIFQAARDGGVLEPTDRKVKTTFDVPRDVSAGALDGEIVLAEAMPGRRLGRPQARILERLGHRDEPRAFSLIAIATHGIPTAFPSAALKIAESARPVQLGSRTDLRQIPLVTIDGADARDFDDAVWAEPWHEGGWHLLVAIADVAWYVRAGDALDRAAHDRGNSVYFPDRVVPMLPESLSNELCSLKPDVERACVAAHLLIDADGNLKRHWFVRGLMRSAARLTYDEVQAAVDGHANERTRALVEPVLQPLYGAYNALEKARRRRGTLELDLPERRVSIDEAGRVAKIEPRPRYASHKLIEEFMIAANVAAAETLEKLRQPCMYRVHDTPDPAKLAALRDFLVELGLPGLTLAKGKVIRPRHFNQILARAAGTPLASMISTLVLRSQAQAVYSPANIGHFGLALRSYAHFTSPIRRYSDLLVHRALIAGHRWEDADHFDWPHDKLTATAEHISMTERRAAAAERGALDRFTAAYLTERVGAAFAARVNGVTRAGLFVTLDETGADGLIPISMLGSDFYVLDEKRHRLVGRRTNKTFTLGDAINVQLAEADAVTGSLAFTPAPGTGTAPMATARAGAKRQRRH